MIERERKFIVNPAKLPETYKQLMVEGKYRTVRTGYFTRDGVAIRASATNHERFDPGYKVCFKGPGTEEREEFEYRIPAEDALRLVELAPFKINKQRLIVDGWEIDFFSFGDTHLVMAEWEEHEGKGPIPSPLPSWVIREVTEDVRFTNQHLAAYGVPNDVR